MNAKNILLFLTPFIVVLAFMKINDSLVRLVPATEQLRQAIEIEYLKEFNRLGKQSYYKDHYFGNVPSFFVVVFDKSKLNLYINAGYEDVPYQDLFDGVSHDLKSGLIEAKEQL